MTFTFQARPSSALRAFSFLANSICGGRRAIEGSTRMRHLRVARGYKIHQDYEIFNSTVHLTMRSNNNVWNRMRERSRCPPAHPTFSSFSVPLFSSCLPDPSARLARRPCHRRATDLSRTLQADRRETSQGAVGGWQVRKQKSRPQHHKELLQEPGYFHPTALKSSWWRGGRSCSRWCLGFLCS
jgi:hypothetical protein